jgi:hypothetical protein
VLRAHHEGLHDPALTEETTMPTVTIRRDSNDLYEPCRMTVLLDGKVIGDGGIGGEAEDNNLARDYAWLRPMIRKLAKGLGAEVVEEVVPDEDDELDEEEDDDAEDA